MKHLLQLTAAAAMVMMSFPCGARSFFGPCDFCVVPQVEAGVNVSFLSMMNATGVDCQYGTVPGFKAGGYAEFRILNGISIETGLAVESKGTRNIPPVDGTRYNSLYLQLPLAAAFHLFDAPGFRVSLEAGGYFAFGLSGVIRNPNNVRYPYFCEDFARRPDAGVLAGFSVLLKERFIVGARYEYGLMNIADTSVSKDIGNLFNNSMCLQVGYAF